jgi:hypothetical protein
MTAYTLMLTEFEFPDELEPTRANFRVVFDVKYWATKTRGEHEVKIANSIKPGADVFWECDPGRQSRPNYVRAMKGNKPLPRVDVESLDEWDRIVLHVEAAEIISVRAKVYDVDRESFFDKIKDFLGGLVEGAVGVGRLTWSDALPVGAKDTAGDSIDEIQSFLVKKVTGGSDKVLFQGSGKPDAKGVVRITRPGTDGKKGSAPYALEIRLQEWRPGVRASAEVGQGFASA